MPSILNLGGSSISTVEKFIGSFQDNPIVAFTLLLLVILTLPPLFERLKLPGLVGLLFAGVVLGSNGLGLLDAETETMKLLSDIGKIYLMFVAGLEIDLQEFRKTKDRSLGFGLATFLVPLIFGAAIAKGFGMGWNAAFLVGSLLASHTLLGYPIINRLGVVTNQAVTVTIGATIFTDIAALLVLAICIAIHGGDFSATSLIFQLVSLAVYAFLVLWGFERAGREYFRRTGDEESNQFLFILLAVFLAAVGAQAIDVDKIVGAFLAGLAVNDVVGHSPVEEKVEFVGSTLFIPIFFVNMGLLLDIPGFANTLTTEFPLTVAVVGGLFASKFLAAAIAKLLYGYTWDETITMWSLSLPQVAATLAAALAGVSAGLIDESVFNVVIVMMLVTAIVGPVLTARFGRKIAPATTNVNPENLAYHLEDDRPNNTPNSTLPAEITSELQPRLDSLASFDSEFRVVVPVANPQTERNLIEMGALLARHQSGIVVPVSIAKAYAHMDDPDLEAAIRYSQQLSRKAVAVAREFGVTGKPIIRIDDDIAHGISRTAREQNASLIVMGWSQTDNLRSRLFGNVIDSVFWSAHCPIAAMRLLKEPIDIHQILVPVKIVNAQSILTIELAKLFAETNQAAITLINVSSRDRAIAETTLLETQLKDVLDRLQPQVETEIKVIRHDDVAQAIITQSQDYDLVILRSVRRRTAGGLAVSNISDRVIRKLECSSILFGEPHQ